MRIVSFSISKLNKKLKIYEQKRQGDEMELYKYYFLKTKVEKK